MTEPDSQQLLEHLAEFVSENKKQQVERVLSKRTRLLTVVLEDIFQPHNASAVVRTCDCFGIQDLHVIENRYAFETNRGVSVGATKWLDIHRYQEPDRENTRRCLEGLKNGGFQIAALTLREPGIPLSELRIDQPLALCFGSEKPGLTEEAHSLADRFVHIPMLGFTQSFNISVSAALTLYELTRRLHASNLDWRLSEEERIDLRLQWYRRIVRNADAHADYVMGKDAE
jgi:tRNA (guanosine-2'-O-)-methyltransferase